MHANLSALVFPALLAGLLLSTGCNLAPKYVRPPVETPAAFKETAGDTNLWQLAQPNDAAPRGPWWEIFHDAQLNALEAQVTVSNQNVAAAFANLLSAQALVRNARSQYYHTLVANPEVLRQRTAAGGGKGSSTFTTYSLPVDASWQLDLWDRVRNTVRASQAEAQASAADLENVRLTAQAELASDYFQLRAQDALQQLYDQTVADYRQSSELTRVLYHTGIDSDQDVAQAETQLQTAQAQATDLGIVRAQLEHAMAMLSGRAASSFSVPPQPLQTLALPVPVALPAQLLERRPDIAAAERRVAAANAQIGVAKAAYFPNLTLSASGGFQSTALENLLDWPSRVWSIGAGMSETLVDFGARSATLAQYRAARDNAAATYRQTVLTAFQQVEDYLATLRILAQEIPQQETAVQSSARYLELAEHRYKLGIDSYLNVITAQNTLLANRQTLVKLRLEQMTATVQLIEALGGGWDGARPTKPPR